MVASLPVTGGISLTPAAFSAAIAPPPVGRPVPAEAEAEVDAADAADEAADEEPPPSATVVSLDPDIDSDIFTQDGSLSDTASWVKEL